MIGSRGNGWNLFMSRLDTFIPLLGNKLNGHGKRISRFSLLDLHQDT